MKQFPRHRTNLKSTRPLWTKEIAYQTPFPKNLFVVFFTVALMNILIKISFYELENITHSSQKDQLLHAESSTCIDVARIFRDGCIWHLAILCIVSLLVIVVIMPKQWSYDTKNVITPKCIAQVKWRIHRNLGTSIGRNTFSFQENTQCWKCYGILDNARGQCSFFVQWVVSLIGSG